MNKHERFTKIVIEKQVNLRFFIYCVKKCRFPLRHYNNVKAEPFKLTKDEYNLLKELVYVYTI